MSTSQKTAYGTGNVAYMGDTSMVSFGSSATLGRMGPAFDNSSNLFVDVLFQTQITTSTGPANDKAFYFYVAAAIDSSSPAYDGMPSPSGSEGNYTFDDASYTPLATLGIVPATTASKVYTKTFSVFAALGFVPVKFCLVVKNYSGMSTSSSSGSSWVKSQGVYYTNS